MLAVIGILCMVGFTVGPSTLDWLDMSRAAQDPVVAVAHGEKIRQSDMGHMRQARYLANRFVLGCLQLALKEQFFYLRFQYGDRLEQYFGPTTDESIVQTRLLAERAQELGMIVSDDAVNEFLRSLTQDKVPREGFKSLVSELNATQAQIFSALRTELAAQRLREMSLPSSPATPAQRWDYYRRLKQRAVAEVAAVPVAEFADEVADPSAEELGKFFDAHKEQEPQPLSPTPGFKIPKQAAFQYFVAEYDKFFDEAAVTPQEIEKYYEENKDQKYLYSAFDFPETNPPEPKQPETEASPAEKKQDGKQSAPEANDGAQPPEKKPEAAKEPAPSSEEKPAAEGKPAADEKTPASDEKTPAEEKKANEPEEGDQSSSLSAASDLAVAALSGRPSLRIAGLLESLLLADESDVGAKTPDAEELPNAAQDAKESPKDKTDAEQADKTDDGEKPGDQPAEDVKKKPAAATKKAPAGPPPLISDDLLLNRDIRSGEKPKYAPLWKVEASIRKELAGQKAVERMNQAFSVIQAKMSRFNRDLDPDETNPKLPDLSGAAEAQQLIEHTTDLQPALAFKDKYPALADATPDQQSLTERPQPLIDIGYGAMAPLRSVVVKDLAGNRYLVWKIKDKDAYVPELENVRDEVVASWKQIQARDLARKRAKALVDKASGSKKPLSETLGVADGVSVTTTPAFSWLTRGAAAGMFDTQTPPKLSEVEGVRNAGSEFMREVFSLGVGDVGEAMNEPQTLCYVVRVVSLEPSREVLRNLFISDPYSQYESASFDDQRGAYDAWIKGIEREAHLEWIQPPDKPQGPSAEEE